MNVLSRKSQPSQPVADSPRKDSAGALERARAGLVETEVELRRLDGARNAALLAFNDGEVARLDGEIATRGQARRTQTDRIALLESEAKRELAEKQAREKASLIGRIEAKFTERDRVSTELRKHVEAADKCFLQIIRLGREARSAWPWQAHDLAATMIADGSVLQALRHELYRCGGRPDLLGGAPPNALGPSFPGGQTEKLEFAMLPDRIMPIDEKLAAATALASRIMKTGYSTNQPPVPAPSLNGSGNGHAPAGDGAAHAVPPANGHAAAPVVQPNPELAALLLRQNELAMLDTLEAEAEYVANGKLISMIS